MGEGTVISPDDPDSNQQRNPPSGSVSGTLSGSASRGADLRDGGARGHAHRAVSGLTVTGNPGVGDLVTFIERGVGDSVVSTLSEGSAFTASMI